MPDPKVTTYVGDNRDFKKTLVAVFLRGGADGLNLVAPLQDDEYYKARPTLGISANAAVKLDGFFGLHPLLKDLAPLVNDGLMSIVHCAGSEDDSRSHFEAQDLMEHGGFVAGGWLGRYLLNTPPQDSHRSPLSAIAIGATLPEVLRGAPSVAAMTSFEDFGLGKKTDDLRDLFASLYGAAPSPKLQQAGSSTIKALKRIDQLTGDDYHPEHEAAYAEDSFSNGMRQIAQLIKADAGMEAATIDLPGWDSHLTQPNVIDPELTKLNAGLTAFCQDLGSKRMEHTTVVVMTEFGRRVRENSALGTDHGRGSVMFVLGGGHQGGKIHADWPGLKESVLEGPGDLPVQNNYRNVISPLLQRLQPSVDLAKVFPGFSFDPLPLFG